MPPQPSLKTTLESLSLAGLSKNDALVYGAILNHPEPSASVRDIMKVTRLSRTMVYYVVGRLLESEVIQSISSGTKTRYAVEPPENLVTLLEKKERSARRQKEMFQSMLPNIRSLYNLSHHKPGVRFFEGLEGIREALHETLTRKKTICAFVDLENIAPVDAINKAYVKERRHLGIAKKILLVDTPKSRAYIEVQGGELTEVKFLPKNITPFKMSMELYDGNVSYLSLRNENPIAVILSDPDVFDMHQKIFDFFWNFSSPQ